MKPADRLLCALIEPLTTGAHFKGWPLHLTIVPWFRIDIANKALTDNLQNTLVGVKPFNVRIVGSEHFGYNNAKLASLLSDPEPFIDIEKRARASLKEHGAWLVDETTRQRRPFRPHVTFQKTGHLNPGDSFRCDSLYIVEQKGDYKEITGKVELHHE